MEIRRLLTDSLDIACAKSANKAAVVDPTRSYTYSDLRTHAIGIANFLVENGLKSGDRVVIFLENSWPIVPSIYGVLYAGGVFSVVNHLTKADKLNYILRDSGATFLITDATVAKQFVPAVEQLHDPKLKNSKLTDPISVICAGQLNLDIPFAFHRFDQVIQTSATKKLNRSINLDLAALIYTSGSTGDAKGVMMTHQNMVFTSDSLIEYLRLDETAKIICFLPLAFDYGLYQILMSVRLGATLIISKSFAFPSVVFEEIKNNQATVFPGVPTVYSTLIGLHQKSPLQFPSVTRVTNTAAALPPEYVPLLKEIFPNALIYKMYGLTECKRVSYLEPEDAEKFPSSVGKAIPGTEVFVLDENRQPVKPNQIGTLYVRGAHVMLGYWNKPEETKKMLVLDLFPGERILCAQDQFTKDEYGNLYFCGRSDDIIKSRGEKVSPVEVENVLYSYPGLREAAVIGVADEVEGQYIKAFVSLEESADADPRKIRQHCIARLENFMVPREVVVLNELPKTLSNKISKKELK